MTINVFEVDVDGCHHYANAEDLAAAQELARWCHARGHCYDADGRQRPAGQQPTAPRREPLIQVHASWRQRPAVPAHIQPTLFDLLEPHA